MVWAFCAVCREEFKSHLPVIYGRVFTYFHALHNAGNSLSIFYIRYSGRASISSGSEKRKPEAAAKINRKICETVQQLTFELLPVPFFSIFQGASHKYSSLKRRAARYIGHMHCIHTGCARILQLTLAVRSWPSGHLSNLAFDIAHILRKIKTLSGTLPNQFKRPIFSPVLRVLFVHPSRECMSRASLRHSSCMNCTARTYALHPWEMLEWRSAGGGAAPGHPEDPAPGNGLKELCGTQPFKPINALHCVRAAAPRVLRFPGQLGSLPSIDGPASNRVPMNQC